MGMTSGYGSKLSHTQIVELLRKVHELGVTFWDTANIYVFPEFSRLLHFKSPLVCQEEIIAKAIKQIGRSNLTIATKSGIRISFVPKFAAIPDGDPAFIRQECEDSLKRLGTDYIDLFYLHRIDQDTPIEITMTEMKKLVNEGKIKYVGLSECSAATIRRAHKIHPISAVQLEWSLWCRGIEEEIVPTCAELGIGIVAYSPLGRGFFGGELQSAKFTGSDFRSTHERLIGEHGEANHKLLENVRRIASEKGVTTAQLALAWVQHQQEKLKGAGVVAIPGTTKERNLISNVGSIKIQLSPEELSALEAAIPEDKVKGERCVGGTYPWEADKNRALTAVESEQIERGIPILKAPKGRRWSIPILTTAVVIVSMIIAGFSLRK